MSRARFLVKSKTKFTVCWVNKGCFLSVSLKDFKEQLFGLI